MVSFKQASAILSDNISSFDIILLDLTLPDKQGNQLIVEMMHLAPNIPIIVLTGFSDMDFAVQAISQGIEDYLLKDELSATILFKSISYAIERKSSKTELKASENRYSNLFHLNPLPMWVYATDTLQFMKVNQAAIQKYGYTEAEFLSMTILTIRPESDKQTLLNIIQRNKKSEMGLNSGRFQHLNKMGDIIEVEIYSAPISMYDRSMRSVIAYDITDKIQHELLITKAIIKTQEEERYEIGSDLHDNICQILALGQMSLDKLKESLTADTLPWYETARNSLLKVLEEIRNLSHRLAPAFYDEVSLEESFRKLLKSFDVDNKYKIEFLFEGESDSQQVCREMHLNLYRILQEQLRNIEKYASATEIKIFILIKTENLYMITIDNGVGFVMDEQKHGIGFANMRRRVELFGGDIEIDAEPGKGCKITITIPLNNNKS